MGEALLAVVLLTAALAGCLGAEDGQAPGESDPETAPSEDPPDEPRELGIELTPCRAIEAFAHVDPEAAREHVPEEFDLRYGENDQALAILGGLRCGEDASGTERGFLAIFVEPRDEALTAEGIRDYFWEPEHHLVAGNAATYAFNEVGADATNASGVELTFGETETSLTIAGIGGTDEAHRASSSVPVAPGGGEEARGGDHFREYSAAEGGYVYLDAAFQVGEPTDRGNAVPMQVQTASGTVARELIGAEAVLPTLSIEGFTYADAQVGFVPRETGAGGGGGR